MKKLTFRLAILIALVTMLSSCTERIDPGFIGMVQTPSGLSGEVLAPGNHTCYGRDKLVLLENAETNYVSAMNVLCKDELNFKFDVNVLARLKGVESGDEDYNTKVTNIFSRQGGKLVWESGVGTLKFDILYNTYVAPKVDAICRSVVSKYETTQIRENRDVIEKEIKRRVLDAVKDTPIEVVTVVTSNFDYPDVITKAQEDAKKNEIDLKKQDAIQALNIKKMDNRLILAITHDMW